MATFITPAVCNVSLFLNDSWRASPIAHSSASLTSSRLVSRWLRTAFQLSLWVHTAAVDTMLSSDCEPSADHILNPAPTLPFGSLTQHITCVHAAVCSLIMAVLSSGTSSGLGQRMFSAAQPRTCSIMMTL